MKKVLLFIMFSVLISGISYCWIRNADIAASRDSVRFGLYSDFSLSYEKIMDSDTSIGISYWPLPLTGYFYFKNMIDISYNKQFYRDDKTSWAYFYGVFGGELAYSDVYLEYPSSLKCKYYWQNYAIPTVGISYGYRFDDRWRARISLLYFLDPYDMELSYQYSENIEISIVASLTNSMFGITYLF